MTATVAATSCPSPTPPIPGSPDDRVDVERQRTRLETFLVIFALCLALFLAALDMTIVTTAIPTIANDFQSSAGYIWIGSAYLLGNASVVPTWGKLSDIFGRKPVLLCSVGIFWIGSLLCAVSTSMSMLIGSRAIQGVGAGGILYLPNVCISDLFSMRQRGMYFGILGLVWAIASAIGPILGGIFASKASWRWCFYINLPFGGMATIILILFLHLHNPRTPMSQGLRAIDLIGNMLIVAGTLLLLIGLDFGGVQFRWSTTICLIVFGIFTLGIFVVYECKIAKYPVLPPRLFHSRTSIATYCLAFTHAFTFMSGSYWLPLYYQGVLGATSLLSGVYLLPYVLALTTMSVSTGFITKKTGIFKLPICLGMIFTTLGFGLFIDLGAHRNLVKIILFQIIAGIGIGPNFQSPLLALQTTVESRDIGAATSSYGFLRQLGTSASVVIGGVVFDNEMQKQQPTLQRELGPDLASLLSSSNAASSVSVVSGLSGHIGDIARAAYWTAIQKMYVVYTCFAFFGLVASLFIRQTRLSKEHKEYKTGLKSLQEKREDEA
jgi:EmrB/QacA subfamily drug resistance transporter